MVFSINTTASSEGTGSPSDRFFGRSLRTKLPNSVNPEIKVDELIRRRIEKHDARITKKNKRNKILYEIGERVRLQNIGTRDWELMGTIERRRTADDGRVVSYDILTDKGYLTSRHRRYLKRLNNDHDPKITNNDKSDVTNNADLPDESVTPPGTRQRRSSRLRGPLSRPKTVKLIKLGEMGAEQSAPLTVDIKVEVDGGTLTVKEVTTREACKDDCGCRNEKLLAKRARRAKRHARARAAKNCLRNEASGDTLQASGSRPGDSLKLSSHGNEVNCSKIKGNTSTNNSGNGRGRGTVGGRRESDASGSGEMEVITLDSSDTETASEL